MIRRGHSQRATARRFRVAMRTIQRWVHRAGNLCLEAVDWRSRSKAPHRVANKISAGLEHEIGAIRRELEVPGDLGFVGAQAIHNALRQRPGPTVLPSVRTIGRVLKRQGLLDDQRRIQRVAPPPGWYLPCVAAQQAALDSFDVVEDLRMENVGLLQVFTARSLWGALAEAWPAPVASTNFVLQALQAYRQRHGLPAFAQFDNDVRFQGSHNHPDVIGRLMRYCLALGVTPVFAPPLETGFQASIENFNGLWQQKVWSRFHHESLPALWAASQRFTQAYPCHLARRAEPDACRRPFPRNWSLDWQAPPTGTVIYLRRTNERGAVKFLGHVWEVDPRWQHRLLRCQVDSTRQKVEFYCLRRREPCDQPLVKTMAYQLPTRRFDIRPRQHHPLTPIP